MYFALFPLKFHLIRFSLSVRKASDEAEKTAQHSAAQPVEPMDDQRSAARPVGPIVCVITSAAPMHLILTKDDQS